MTDLSAHREMIGRLAGEGISDARIAKRIPETTGQQVYRFRQAHGIIKAPTRWGSRLDPYAEEIRDMYVTQRMTDKAIADSLPVEVDADTVRQFRLSKLSIPTDRAGRSSERYVIEDVWEKYKAQLPQLWEESKQFHSRQQKMVGSAERVGKRIGVSASTAQKLLRRAGLFGSRPKLEVEGARAKELFDQGYSVNRIAEETGQKVDSVRNWLNALGCDLSGYTTRMSHDEKMAWRGAISDGKSKTEDTNRIHPYKDTLLGSKWEVIVATQCDRVGLSWRPYSRLEDGVLDYKKNDGFVSRYAPDLVVEYAGVRVDVEVKGIYSSLDQLKVRTWRDQKGRLALLLKEDVLELEHAVDDKDAFSTILAATYTDPVIKIIKGRV